MFSRKKSLSVTKGKPLVARQQTVEVKAVSTDEFLKAEKFQKSEQGGSSACSFIYSAAAVQGFRSRMQDDYACNPDLTIKGSAYSFFGVFDGHGENGEIVSQFCADTIPKQLLHRKAIKQSKVITNELLAASMHKTLVKLDCQLRGIEGDTRTNQFRYGGTTACCILISQEDFIFVNVGDSRAVLCRDGGVVFETKDHNPDVPEEEERITAAGGHVHTTPSRLKIITDNEGFNNLCVSRTIGDFNFKPSTDLPPELQPVSPAPDISVVPRDLNRDEFLVIASDGIYKSLSSSQVVQFVQRQLMISEDLTRICRNLIDTAYYAKGNIPDDTTVILVKFSGAPSISNQAMAEERQFNSEAKAAIEQEVKGMIDRANTVRAVDNDFSIIQNLVQKLPETYRVQERVSFIIETATRLRNEKFGNSNGCLSVPKDGDTSPENESSPTISNGSSANEDCPTNQSTTLCENTSVTESSENNSKTQDSTHKDSDGGSQPRTDSVASAISTNSTSGTVCAGNVETGTNSDATSTDNVGTANSTSGTGSVETAGRVEYCVIGTGSPSPEPDEAQQVPIVAVDS